jgi:hypothetical protein
MAFLRKGFMAFEEVVGTRIYEVENKSDLRMLTFFLLFLKLFKFSLNP